jgi:hypothetical protein
VDEARPPVVAATAAVGVAVGVAAGIMQVDRPSPPPFRSQSPTTSTMALRTATIQLLWMLRREQVEWSAAVIRQSAAPSCRQRFRDGRVQIPRRCGSSTVARSTTRCRLF